MGAVCHTSARDALPSSPVSYWTGVGRRALPALVVGVVAGVVMGLVTDDWSSVWLVGGATSLAALLLPPRRSAGAPGSTHEER